MKILYFIDSISNYRSGVHASTMQTCMVMQEHGHRVTLIGANDAAAEIPKLDNVNIIGFRTLGPKSLNILWGLREWLELNIQDYNLVSIETIWSFSNYFIVNSCIKYNIPFVVTTHGMLHTEALKVSAIKKKIAHYTFLKKLFNSANAFHALNSYEKEMIQNFGIKRQIFIVGNGINLPKINTVVNNAQPEPYSKFINKKFCLYIGRLHPIKGVDRLIESWIKLNYDHDWQLVIAGDGDPAYEDYLKSLINIKIHNNITFVGFVTHNNKELLYNKSKFCVLPSHSEAFPMAILESFSYSKPALITTSCVFEEAIKYNAAIQVESSFDGILSGLNLFLSKTEIEIEEMGNNGFNLVQSEFNWEIIYKKLFNEYALITNINRN